MIIFLCYPQAYRVCDWWSNVDCPTSEQLYSNNEELYRDAEGNLIWGAASREVGGDDVGPEVFSTTTRTPLEQPLVRPTTTLAKLIEQQQHLGKAGHQQAHINHVGEVVDERDRNSFSHSSNGRISGTRFSIATRSKNHNIIEGEEDTIVNKEQQEGQQYEKGSGGGVKLLSSNDINTISYSALTGKGTNPKEALGRKESSRTTITPKTTKKRGSRGSKKFKLNQHDKEEMEFIHNSIKAYDSKPTSTTTKRSTSTIPNKYNIDYDNMLEDEYEIIQKIE